MVPAVLAFQSVSLVPAIRIFQGLKISTDGSDSSSSQRHLNFSGWIFVIYVECCYIVNLLTIIWITLTQGLNTQKIVVEFQSSIVLTCIQFWKARYVSPFFEHGLSNRIYQKRIINIKIIKQWWSLWILCLRRGGQTEGRAGCARPAAPAPPAEHPRTWLGWSGDRCCSRSGRWKCWLSRQTGRGRPWSGCPARRCLPARVTGCNWIGWWRTGGEPRTWWRSW